METEIDRIAGLPSPTKKVKVWQATQWFCGSCVLCSKEFMVVKDTPVFFECYGTGWCPRCVNLVNSIKFGDSDKKHTYYANHWYPNTCWKFKCRVCGAFRAYSDDDQKVVETKFNWECARCEQEHDVTLVSQGTEGSSQ